ncbi:alanine:cation symporter family protein [Brevibacterium sp. p3-SID960]|uniref:alanine/glycine:cation symporter family protein n=1 Tax=Brevibacterium sp. p3-SID960 TaxID=2916063 RepID=UPI0021A37BE9|nr:alanine:cation symporter family protein [Brevibacterium sp. p3-SID960]MCT1690373.1 alanine:cation symporter family protein [Brevibacterium sp. p3-SID960]
MIAPPAVLAGAADQSGSSVDQFIDGLFAPFAEWLSFIVFFEIPLFGVGLPLIVVWLMVGAIFLTVFLRFQPITGLKHSLRVIRGKFTRKTDPGEVSSFQALATELSGTVGLGNIAGVAVAITIGGPGAALWIIIFGLLAMSMKMAEATLGVKYRQITGDGKTSGGPMYYLREGLAEVGWPRLGKFLAVFYALTTLIGVFGAGNLFQANQVAAIIVDSTGGDSSFLADKLWLIGLVMALLAGFVIIGGIKKIAEWTSAITPAMAILYTACVLVILAMNVTAVPHAFWLMIEGAFTGEGVAGGIVGVAIVGIQRALFSNVGGVGTAGMAHAAVKTDEPATEGFTAMWEPLVDSVIICTLTALAIITTGLYQADAGDGSTGAGVALTSQAFATVSAWFPYLLTVAVVLFGFSTVLSYAYYGQKALGYLTKNSVVAEKIFQFVWVAAVVVGSAVSLDSVVAFSDATLFLMAVPNLLGLYFLSKIVRMEIIRHKTKVAVGTMSEVPADLQVGLRDHEPTPEQVEREKTRRHKAREHRKRVRSGFRSAQRKRGVDVDALDDPDRKI